jgi:hypothetical protein
LTCLHGANYVRRHDHANVCHQITRRHQSGSRCAWPFNLCRELLAGQGSPQHSIGALARAEPAGRRQGGFRDHVGGPCRTRSQRTRRGTRMTSRESNNCSHGKPPTQLQREPFCAVSHAGHNRNRRGIYHFFAECVLTYRKRPSPAASLQVRSKFSSSLPVVAWGQPCVRFTNERSRTRRKSNARSCRALHVCADRSLAWLAKHYGRSKLLKRWLRWLDARSAPPPMRYPANENHQRSRSLPCSPKSLPSANKRRPF